MLTIVTTVIAFFIDQRTKMVMTDRIKKGQIKNKMDGMISFKLTKNTGFMLSKFKDKPHLVTGIHFLMVTLIAIILLPLSFSGRVGKIEKIGYGLILGGGLGNLYDRLTKDGVTDFFSFKFKPNIIFNLADMFIFFGSIIVACIRGLK